MEPDQFINVDGRDLPVKSDRIIGKNSFYKKRFGDQYVRVQEDGSLSNDVFTHEKLAITIKNNDGTTIKFSTPQRYSGLLVKHGKVYYVLVNSVVDMDAFRDETTNPKFLSESDHFLVKMNLTNKQQILFKDSFWQGARSIAFIDSMKNGYGIAGKKFYDEEDVVNNRNGIKEEVKCEGFKSNLTVDKKHEIETISDVEHGYKYWLYSSIFVGIALLVFFIKLKK